MTVQMFGLALQRVKWGLVNTTLYLHSIFLLIEV